MNDNSKTLKELTEINEDLEKILNNLPEPEVGWKDEVGIKYKEKLEKVIENKNKLKDEIKKLELLLKNNNNS